MEKAELIRKIRNLMVDCETSGVMIGEDNDGPEVLVGSRNKRMKELGDRIQKQEEEIIDSLCQHKWKTYTKTIYECEICKSRRFSEKPL